MSLGYAERLSIKEDVGGTLGAPEVVDDDQAIELKIDRLVQLVSMHVWWSIAARVAWCMGMGTHTWQRLQFGLLGG